MMLDQLKDRVNDSSQAAFAILDACDEPRVPAFVKIVEERAVSLYKGTAEEELHAIAPYLVSIDRKILDWISDELFGTPWGIFVFAATDLDSLRKHFRRFLIVNGPEGNELYFRYYDPRVLPTFLTSCSGVEAERFFGPVSSFVVEADDNQLQEIQLR